MTVMMKRVSSLRKCRVALDSIAMRYSLMRGLPELTPPTIRRGASSAGGDIYFPFTLEVIDAMTIDAILNCSLRFVMPWRAAIQAKSV
jgi:hypothetical protein